MRINIAEALKQPGRVHKLQAQIEYQPIEYLGRELVFDAPLSLTLEYSFDGEGIPVTGRADTALKSECARCLKPVVEPFGFDIDASFIKGADADSEAYPYSGDEVDLTQLLLDELLLNAPMYSVCSEDCKGLCPVCGCDLNVTRCSCAAEVEDMTDNPFRSLAKLLDDDKEV